MAKYDRQYRLCKRTDCEFHIISSTGANLCSILPPQAREVHFRCHFPSTACPMANHPDVIKPRPEEPKEQIVAPLIEWSTMMEWLHKVKVGEKL